MALKAKKDEKAPETAPAAAASRGEVVVAPLPAPEPVKTTKVKLKQDLLLNGVMYKAGGTYELPEDAFGVFKYAME